MAERTPKSRLAPSRVRQFDRGDTHGTEQPFQPGAPVPEREPVDRADTSAELGNLSHLVSLQLNDNLLTGEIPSELGNLTKLTILYLNNNELTREIPPELAELSNLRRLRLAGNELTGCIPQGLRDVTDNDFDELNLPFCVCVKGGAVTDASNKGLVSDCNILIAVRDILTGTASLNWSADLPIVEWDGITIGGTPERVTELFLAQRQLTGKDTPGTGQPVQPRIAESQR